MSAEATGWVWKNSPYSGAQLLVHLAIADVVNDVHENEFWMSTHNLAKKAKVSRSTVTATLTEMVQARHLALINAGGESRTPSIYRFIMASAAVGLVEPGPLARSSDVTSPISDDSLDRSPRAIPKEITQEPKAEDFSQLADPNCFQCHGKGTAYMPGAGRDARCPCTKPLAKSVQS